MSLSLVRQRKLSACVLGALMMAPLSFSASAAEVTVKITGARSDEGQILCAIYSSEKGFPTKGKSADEQQKHTPQNGKTTCVYSGLAAGDYAVAASHDKNSNGKTDKNFLGIPRETWGVSKNVRPNLRAPKFAEALFSLAADENLTITIELDK